jgi:ABC-2 type transport system ATP-binding protein
MVAGVQPALAVDIPIRKMGGDVLGEGDLPVAFITVADLKKTYRVAHRPAGIGNALRSLVHRQYTTVTALKGVSFTVDEGEIVGYIGPNGAGKSTTVKILSGILVPDSGRCEIMGLVPWRRRLEHVRRIGVVFGQRSQLWWDVPVIDSFELLRDIYAVPVREYRSTRDELVQRLALAELLEVPARQLSMGQRMRCEIAASLLHRPQLLFLDEPTIGLDAVSKLALRDFIRQLNREHGTTVILTTHDLDDIEALCSRVMVIGRGAILHDGCLADLRRSYGRLRRLTVEFAAAPGLLDLGPVERVTVAGNRAEIAFDPNRVSPANLIARVARVCPARDLMVESLPIEEIIANMYRELAL